MLHKLILPAILLALLPAGAAIALDANGSYGIRGAGTVTCTAYLKATPRQRQHAESWWAGYLTAMNRTTPKPYDLLGNIKIAAAVHELMRAAYTRRQQTSPK